MDSRYSYDDDQQVWPFFAVTILGCALVPSTISQVMAMLNKTPRAARKNYSSQLTAYDASKKRRSKTWILLAVGWVLMAMLINIIRNIEQSHDESVFDPWQLLDVGRSATEKEIKSAYRKLTVKFHPDKIRDLGNMTVEEVEDRYVTLTKAYKSLTDEDTRENFLRYGHPDGPQTQLLGIALPKFLIEGGTPLLFAVYALIGIGVPILAARWWSKLASRNSSGILQSSADKFFTVASQEQLMFLSADDILDRIVECDDFEDGKTPVERRKALEAQFNGGSGDPNTTTTAVKLLHGLHAIAFEFKMFEFCRRVVDLQKCIVMGVPPQRTGAGAKLQDQSIAVPRIHVLDAQFKVPGLDVVPPGSVPHLVVKYLVVPPKAAKMPEIAQEVLEDDLIAGNIRVLRDPLYSNKLAPPLPPVESSVFPMSEEYIPKWNAYIYGDMERILSQPVALENVDLSNMALSPEQFASGDGVVVSTFKVILGGPLPPQLAKIPLKFALLNTGYFGCDVRTKVQVETKNIPVVEVEESDEEAEEEEKLDEESDLSDIDTDTEDEQD